MLSHPSCVPHHHHQFSPPAIFIANLSLLPNSILNLGLNLGLKLFSLLFPYLHGAPQPNLFLATPVMPIEIAIALCQLRALVDEMARKQQIVLRRDGERIPHERRRVNGECERHLAGDAVQS